MLKHKNPKHLSISLTLFTFSILGTLSLLIYFYSPQISYAASTQSLAVEACSRALVQDACQEGFVRGYKAAANATSKEGACGGKPVPPPRGTVAPATISSYSGCVDGYQRGVKDKDSDKLADDAKDKEGSKDKSEDTSPDCTTDLGSPLSWIICPLVDLSSAATDFFFKDLVQPLLDEVPVTAKGNDPGYKAWQGFRLLANIILVGAMILLVYGTATRGGGGR